MNAFQNFEQFYGSFWQQPVSLVAVAVLALIYIVVNKNAVKSSGYGFQQKNTYLLVFAFIAILDAWLTANEVVGIGALSPPFVMIVPLVFVYLGDFRYFLLMEKMRSQGRLALALALSAVVPCLSAALQKVFPPHWQTPRHLFLTYELMFLILLGVYYNYIWRKDTGLQQPVLRRFRDLTRFVGLYYGIWAASDALILVFNLDGAFGLRTIANLLYYGGFMITACRCLSMPETASSLKK